MSDLKGFRDHCAHMATREHKLECQWPSRLKVEAHNRMQERWERLFNEPEGSRTRAVFCEGCNNAKDRALFAHLAAEVDDYLTTADEPMLEIP